MSETKHEQKLVEVVLAKPHTHAGLAYDAKAKIQVTAPERDWLIAQQIVNAPPAQKEGAK